jgi:hypothetical protein
MNPHRVHILDRADDDGIVRAVADHLHLIFLPPDQAFVDQHLGRRRGLQPRADDVEIFLPIVGDPAARPAQREARPDDDRKPDRVEHAKRFLDRVDDGGLGALQPDPVHRIAELLPVLGLLDRLGVGPDQLDAQPVQRAVLEQGQSRVQSRLPAHGRKQRVRLLRFDDLRHNLWRDRLDIGRVAQLRIGHDRRRIGVDHDDAVPLLLQRLDRLGAAIVELRRLPDDDRASTDDEDGGDVGAAGHLIDQLCCFEGYHQH